MKEYKIILWLGFLGSTVLWVVLVLLPTFANSLTGLFHALLPWVTLSAGNMSYLIFLSIFTLPILIVYFFFPGPRKVLKTNGVGFIITSLIIFWLGITLSFCLYLFIAAVSISHWKLNI